MRDHATLPLLFVLAVSAMATTARAGELRMTVEAPHFTCEGRGAMLSHAAYVPGDYRRTVSDETPLPCCDGQLGCAQFLSTNTILHPAHPMRG